MECKTYMQYSNETNELLFQMYPDNSIDKSNFTHDTLIKLFKDGYIINSGNFHDNTVHLSDAGKAYVEQIVAECPLTAQERVLKWVKNNVFEIIAIIISIIALLKP